MVLCVTGFIVAVMISSLLCYHLGLVASNATTQEQERDKYDQWGGNHYNNGTCTRANCFYFFKK